MPPLFFKNAKLMLKWIIRGFVAPKQSGIWFSLWVVFKTRQLCNTMENIEQCYRPKKTLDFTSVCNK